MDLKTTVECDKCQGNGRLEKVNPAALRHIRWYAGLSLRAMAKRVKISAPYLSDIERGNRACPKKVEAAYSNLSNK